MSKKMIPENWKIIEQIESEAQKQIEDPQARFNANLFFLGTDQRHLVLHIKYRKKKKDGSFTDKYYDLQINATHCPFSGKPLYEEAPTAARSPECVDA